MKYTLLFFSIAQFKQTAPLYFSGSFVQLGTAEFGPINLVPSLWKKCNGTMQCKHPPQMTVLESPFLLPLFALP